MFKCCSWSKDKGHTHGTLPNDPQHHPPESPFINIGVYLDESNVLVGTIDKTNTQEPEIILEFSADITFLNDRIILGQVQEMETSRDNRFKVYDLIKEASTPIQIVRVNGLFLTLTKEEILAIFFEKLFSQVKIKTSVGALDYVVVTLPFNVSSLEKEKIKLAINAAGIFNIRICSSLVTTAISYAHENQYFSFNEAKTLFMGQYTKTGFAVALINVAAGFVVTEKCVSSQNLEECQETEFKEYHARMYDNEIIKSEKTYNIFKIYSKAVASLCSKDLLFKCEPVIVKVTEKRTTLDQNFVSIFEKDIQCSLISSGPLLGACLLASKFLPGSGIPSNTIICDVSRANLLWKFGDSQKVEKVGNFCPGIVFESQLTVSPKTNNLILKEVFASSQDAVVGHYRVEFLRGELSSSVKAKLMCRVDQNGILGVGFAFPSGIFAHAVRTSGPTISRYSSSGYTTLRYFYKLLGEISDA